ncbi:DUF6550 family protein [Ruminiclostridium cellulolyticum]|uniref:Uncharacterized protein n=1 Tax=Ruminiclostridium cellulolyticum (strain ATCC 35319 / DSM 5812 / JCM 6584 / H10) TaxID=394503 RepID=B8I7J7_RUMCH|nr:DUF6550 family protein [Ruminiclostridium cellulolyticum]ACL77068.1 conserved hypothetical protein [Ruminiclostridium cellulolyticum H10]
MKKKQMKWLIVTGLGIICIILIAAIASKFKWEAPKEIAVASPSAAQVNPAVVTPSEALKTEKNIVIQDINPSYTTSTNTAVSSGTKQTIQPDPVKPKTPTVSKPKVQEKVTPKAPDSAKKPVSKQPDAVKNKSSGKTEPKGGEKRDGKIYVPGFGWVKDNGGGVHQEIVGSDGDINKQVGTMD